MQKGGIFYFVPTNQLADNGGGGNRDLKVNSSTTGGITITNLSDLTAELSDYHLDVGKTMGIRRVILGMRAAKVLGNTVSYRNSLNQETDVDHGFDGWELDSGQINVFAPDYNRILGIHQSLLGEATTESSSADRTYNHRQFLLVNLNFKSPVASTSTAQTKWTFATKVARESNGTYVVKDIGKVAFQTDEESWWVLTKITKVSSGSSYTPTWESQDKESQIIIGCLRNQTLLFPILSQNSDGTDTPFYAYMNQEHTFETSGFPLRDLKDQRALYDSFGDGALFGLGVEIAPFTGDTDPTFIPENYPQWNTEPFHGFSLGIFADADAINASGPYTVHDVGRRAYYLIDEFPFRATLINHNPVQFSFSPGAGRVVVNTPTDVPISWDGDISQGYLPGNGTFRVRPYYYRDAI